MGRYELLLYAHIVCGVLWVGAHATLTLMLVKARGPAADPGEVRRLPELDGWLTPRLFVPASMLTLLFGILLVADGPWTFGHLWIVLALSGFTISFVLGGGRPRTRGGAAARSARGAQ